LHVRMCEGIELPFGLVSGIRPKKGVCECVTVVQIAHGKGSLWGF